VPQNNATAFTPGKEQHKPRNEHASENSHTTLRKPEKNQTVLLRVVNIVEHTRLHTRFMENDTTSTSRRHGNHTSSDNDGSSTESSDNEQHGKTDKQRQTKRSSKRHKRASDNGSDQQTTSTAGKQRKVTRRKHHRRQSSSSDASHERSNHRSRHDNKDLTNKDTSRHSSHHQPTDLTQDMEQRARTRTRHKRHSSPSSSSSDKGSKRPGKDKHSESKNQKKSHKTHKSSPDKRKDMDAMLVISLLAVEGMAIYLRHPIGIMERSHQKVMGHQQNVTSLKSPSPIRGTAHHHLWRDLGKKVTEVNILTPTLTNGTHVISVDVHRRDRSRSSTRPKHKFIKPPHYDGSTPVEIYLAKFNRASAYNNWTSKDKVFHLTNLLTEAAELLIDHEHELTYDQLVDKLRQRYGSKEQHQMFKSQLEDRERATNESLQELGQHIEQHSSQGQFHKGITQSCVPNETQRV